MKKALVIGAGLSGLIVANLLRARGYDIDVFERQEYLPDNHKAVLRFRSPALGDALGVPFKKVQALLCLAPFDYLSVSQNAFCHSMAYSYATTGIRRTDRSITRLLDGPKVVDRWIAPPNFREILLDRIQSRVRFNFDWIILEVPNTTPVVSTIPMRNVLMMLGDADTPVAFSKPPDFGANAYLVVSADARDTDAYGSIYNPLPEFTRPWTRISINGSRVSMEVSLAWPNATTDASLHTMLEREMGVLLGLDIDYVESAPKVYHSKNDRILPISDRFRKAFIMHLTDEHNIYSLGRFATWRPGMLLDDLIQDTNIVASMIEGDAAPRYEAAK